GIERATGLAGTVTALQVVRFGDGVSEAATRGRYAEMRFTVGPQACRDGVDDDADGLTDFAGGDPDCSSPNDPTETGPPIPCDDGVDRDADGVCDVDEGLAGTDPDDPDSDGDGLLDGFEVLHGFDPLDPDEGTNGTVDGQDDADADGLGNAAEDDAGTDPLDPDTDDDGLLDGEELGTGSFGPQQVITTLAVGARSVFAADVDGDGDLDVLSASGVDDKIAWYENTDGPGSFGPQQVITTLADGAASVFAADVDGDGDLDVLSASRTDDKIAWYENTGGGGFGSQQLISILADGAESVFAADVDGDGDPDVLSASFFDDKIAWYENTDGLGSFGPQQVITTAADGAHSV
ncbi:MAG: hypothetical protein GTN95_11180, partial [Gammaproteobacteria bacterium]|nr:hypothetical protein [Gammaproteobacteria bacterium]